MALTSDDLPEVHRLAFDSALDAIFVFGADDSLLLANVAARELAARGCAISELRDHEGFAQFRSDLRARGRATLEARLGERAYHVAGRALGARSILFVRDVTGERDAEEDVTRLWGLASIGALTASLVHDVGNLMTPLATLGDALSRDVNSDVVVELRRATTSATDLVREVRAFLRGRSRPPEPLEVNHVLRELRALIDRVLGTSYPATLMLDAEDGPVLVERARLERAVLNLVANARDAMRDGGRVAIRTYSAWFDGASYLALSVSDTGAGMTPTERERAFEPLFTTKTEHGGTGLGLWMVRRFVREARGRLSIKSEVGAGTEIILYLPRAQGPFPPA